MKRLAIIAAMAATGLLAMGALAGQARADQWNKTYQISGHANLRVTTGDGDVRIVAANQNQIDAKVTTSGYKIGTNDVQVIESQTGDTVSIEVKLPHWNWNWGIHKAVQIDLRVPQSLDADVRTGDGNIDIQMASGNLHFDTGDGNITASGVRGTIEAKSGDGNITGQNFDGSLEASTGDGNINVGGRFDALTLKSGDGSIEAQAAAGSKISESWSVESGDGRINMRVAGDLQANLDAHTGDGVITLDVPVQVSGSLSHSEVRGKMNGGGGELRLRSGDGSIHLEKI
ncbi:MAG: DUF4097 family beta strand repeat-containing protein [Candidatus Acidiferrales bacterium]